MIYLVDDDASVREALVLLLSTYGKEVTAFPDARTCSPIWTRQSPAY